MKICKRAYLFVFIILTTFIIGCSPNSDVPIDTNVLGTNVISVVDCSQKAVCFWPSVIAASCENTNAVYYAGTLKGKVVLVHETSDGIKQGLYEDVNIDSSIIMPYSHNRGEWILLKGSGDDKVRFWDWQQEIRDFISARPRNSALVRRESSFLSIDIGPGDVIWLVDVYAVDVSLCQNLSKGDRICTIELFDCDVKERKDMCARARLGGTTIVRRRECRDGRLLYAHWNSGEFVRVEDFCSEPLFCIDNEIVAPFEFAWDGVYDGLIRFDENLAIDEYRRKASLMVCDGESESGESMTLEYFAK